MQDEKRWIVGLMSGTSLDGVDAALLRTDGVAILEIGKAATYPYSAEFRGQIEALICDVRHTRAIDDMRAAAAQVETELTLRHADAVSALVKSTGLRPSDIALIGFHGQTISHRPGEGLTCQIGDAELLARETGIPVVFDFRSADVAAGGEGAPLAPAYHRALVQGRAEAYPVAVLNIGGVANLTWVVGTEDDADLIAFDTGPGNAMLDDFVRAQSDATFDRDGSLAFMGCVDEDAVTRFLNQSYFSRKIPKSLDRNEFSDFIIPSMSVEDGAATRTALTVAAIRQSLAWLPEAPREWWVSGGGRHNRAIMAGLAEALGVPVRSIDEFGFDGDAIEAQAFAFLAARVAAGLPISFPLTTGVKRPLTGGRLVRP